jgi:hypothetical protein
MQWAATVYRSRCSSTNTATAAGFSVLPLSAAVEVVATRQAVHIMIGCVGYPYLLLRLGRATMPAAGPRRAPAAQVIDRR